MVKHVIATGVISTLMLAALMTWQMADGPARVDTISPLPLPASGTTTDQPRRFADYENTGSPAADQCHLPVEQRTGKWICPKK